MLQRNPHPWPVTLPEYREPSGTVHPTRDVDGGADIDWPIPIAGFDNLEPEPAPAEASTAEQSAPAETDTPTDSAPATAAAKPAAAKASGKTREGVSA